MAAPLGVLAKARQQPPVEMKKKLMAGSLGVLLVAATTKVEDVDGGPLGVLSVDRWQPPLKFKTSMAGPLGVLAEVR
jgi:hypothetical protein